MIYGITNHQRFIGYNIERAGMRDMRHNAIFINVKTYRLLNDTMMNDIPHNMTVVCAPDFLFAEPC